MSLARGRRRYARPVSRERTLALGFAASLHALACGGRVASDAGPGDESESGAGARDTGESGDGLDESGGEPQGVLWDRVLGGDDTWDVLAEIATLPGGDLVVSGARRELADGAWLARFDLDGQLVWERFEDSVSGAGDDLAVDEDGRIYMGGHGRLFRYDEDGELIWARSLEGTKYVTALALDGPNLLVAGAEWFADPPLEHPGPFLRRYNAESVELGELRYPELGRLRMFALVEDALGFIATGIDHVTAFDLDDEIRWTVSWPDAELLNVHDVTLSSSTDEVIAVGFHRDSIDQWWIACAWAYALEDGTATWFMDLPPHTSFGAVMGASEHELLLAGRIGSTADFFRLPTGSSSPTRVHTWTPDEGSCEASHLLRTIEGFHVAAGHCRTPDPAQDVQIWLHAFAI